MTLFIPALWMASGISLFAGVLFVVTGVLRWRERIFLVFGVLCLLLAFYTMLSAQWYQAQSQADAARIMRMQMGLVCFIYPVFVWFASLFTRQEHPERPRWLFTLPFVFFFIVNLFSPVSYLYNAIEMDAPIVLSWGEAVNYYQMTASPWAPIHYVLVYGIFIWAAFRCVALWHNGYRGRSTLFGIYLVIQLATIIDALVMDRLSVRSVYLGEFAALVLVALMSVFFARELHRRSSALETSVDELRAETGKRREFEEQLRYMAYHDYLTDLPNRRMLREELRTALHDSQTSNTYSALLLLDLDHFKTINDSLGHEIGDELLRHVARQLRAALPESVQPARVGGDEFAVIATNLSSDQRDAEAAALRVARTITDALSSPFEIGDHELVIGTSIGTVLFAGDEADDSTLMRRADMALYRAKAAGRNTVQVFAAPMQRDADERHALERGLRGALERDEFEFFFQLQFDTDDHVVGVEALLHWRRAENEYVGPDRFIPVAEESGLIHPIGDYVLRGITQRISAWHELGLPLPARFSINVSPWQLSSPEFSRKIHAFIAESGVNPAHLTFEITESTFLHNVTDIADKIRALAESGIQFSVDDFGTGYSALAHLKQLPVHEIKIDRTFVHGMDVKRRDKFVETIVAIAQHMNLRVVAEGVEKRSQLEALIRIGCRSFQGYLFGQPMTESVFIRWLADHQTRIRNTG